MPDPKTATGDVADWLHGYQLTSNVFVPKILGRETVDIVGYDIRGGHFATYTDQPQFLAALRTHALKFCREGTSTTPRTRN